MDPISAILADYTQSQKKAPRKPGLVQYYQRLYYETRVKPHVDLEWPAVVQRAAAKGAPPPQRVTFQNMECKRMFELEKDAFKAELERQRDEEYADELASWERSSASATVASFTAEDYER